MEQIQKQEGPEYINIPQHTNRVCGNCIYHKKERMMCGHDYVTDNYSCMHPEANPDGIRQSIMGEGRIIAFNSRKEPATPSWCPYLNQQPK